MASADVSEDSFRFLWSVGGGVGADSKAYGLHLRLSADKITEYDAFGYGAGFEFAKSSLSEFRDFDTFYYSFDYLLGLRLMAVLRTSDIYTTSLVLAGGPTRVSFSSSLFTSAAGGFHSEFDPANVPYVDHKTQGKYASLGVHFQREYPSLVRLSEWGMTFSYYRAQFASGWIRDGLYDYTTAPGLMDVFLFNLHIGIGGIVDL